MLLEGGINTENNLSNFINDSKNKAEILGLKPSDLSSIEEVIVNILEERADFVAERGMAAIGPLMGVVMGKLGGAADGKAVSTALKKHIQRLL